MESEFTNNTNLNEIEQIIKDACRMNNLNFIKEYINSGHNVNEYLISGWTLMHYAATYCQASLIKYLLNRGADPNSHHEGYTPLITLSNSIQSSSEKRMTCLKYLLEAKANVNATNKHKETALMYACKVQEINFIMELLNYGAHINLTDSENRTALFYAVFEDRYEVVEMLIDKGADISLTNWDGLTAYDVAQVKGYNDLFPLLEINHGNIIENVEIDSISHWTHMFPHLHKVKEDEIDIDVENILFGMGLERYKTCFCGMDLSTFLKLREEDLEILGVDISVHRKKFMNGLFKFHEHDWNNQIFKTNKIDNFSAYHVIQILGNINKQLSVMSSSVYYSKNYLDFIKKNSEMNLSSKDKEKLNEEIKNLYVAAYKIQCATNKIKSIVTYISGQSHKSSYPLYIGKKKEKNNHKWILLTLLSITSFYFFKIKSFKLLSVNEKYLNTMLPSVLTNTLKKIGFFVQKST